MIIILSQFVVFVAALPPLEGTSRGFWFALFQQNKIKGLLAFELLMVIYTILSVPLALALFVTLRKVDPSLTAIYMALTLIGVVSSHLLHAPLLKCFSSAGNTAAAAADAQRSAFLAAGETLVAMFHGFFFKKRTVGVNTSSMFHYNISSVTSWVRSVVCSFRL